LKVIDVGGGINSWCKHTSHVVDIFVDPGSKEEFERIILIGPSLILILHKDTIGITF